MKSRFSAALLFFVVIANQKAMAQCSFYLDRMEQLLRQSQAAIMLAKEQKAVGDRWGFCQYMKNSNSDLRKAIANYESWMSCFGTNDQGVVAEINELRRKFKLNSQITKNSC